MSSDIPPLREVVYLGSQSSTKAKCLEAAGFEVISEGAYVDEEVAVIPPNIGDMVIEIAQRKVNALKKKYMGLAPRDRRSNFLLCGDVVIHTESGEARGKPESADEARKWLKGYYQTGYFTAYLGVIVLDLESGQQVEGFKLARVCIDKSVPMLDEEIDAYIAEGKCMEACGAVRVDSDFFQQHILNIEGDITTVLGMNPTLVRTLMARLNWLLARQDKCALPYGSSETTGQPSRGLKASIFS